MDWGLWRAINQLKSMEFEIPTNKRLAHLSKLKLEFLDVLQLSWTEILSDSVLKADVLMNPDAIETWARIITLCSDPVKGEGKFKGDKFPKQLMLCFDEDPDTAAIMSRKSRAAIEIAALVCELEVDYILQKGDIYPTSDAVVHLFLVAKGLTTANDLAMRQLELEQYEKEESQ